MLQRMLTPLWAIRSVVAFVGPAILGAVVLAGGRLAGLPRQSRNANAWLTGWLAPRLAGFTIEVDGEISALSLRPAVIVFNHQSGVDPVIMARLAGRDSIGLVKQALGRHPLLGPLLRMQGALFIQPDGSNQALLASAARRICDEKLALLIAPEGKRTRELAPFRAGAIRLARLAQVPIVPVVIHNSGAILAPHALIMRPGPVRVSVLAPQPHDAHEPDTLRALFVQALA